MKYPYSRDGKYRWSELSSFDEHGQTFGDMNKSHKTDPHPQSRGRSIRRDKKMTRPGRPFFKKKYIQAPYGAEAPK